MATTSPGNSASSASSITGSAGNQGNTKTSGNAGGASDITSFLTYLNEVKPFHTKLNESSVVIQYSLEEQVNVKMFDFIDSISAKLSSFWTQSWKQKIKGFPIIEDDTTYVETGIWIFHLNDIDPERLTSFNVYENGVVVDPSRYVFDALTPDSKYLTIIFKEPIAKNTIIQTDIDRIKSVSNLAVELPPIVNYPEDVKDWVFKLVHNTPNSTFSNLEFALNGNTITEGVDFDLFTENGLTQDILTLRFYTPLSSTQDLSQFILTYQEFNGIDTFNVELFCEYGKVHYALSAVPFHHMSEKCSTFDFILYNPDPDKLNDFAVYVNSVEVPKSSYYTSGVDFSYNLTQPHTEFGDTGPHGTANGAKLRITFYEPILSSNVVETNIDRDYNDNAVYRQANPILRNTTWQFVFSSIDQLKLASGDFNIIDLNANGAIIDPEVRPFTTLIDAEKLTLTVVFAEPQLRDSIFGTNLGSGLNNQPAIAQWLETTNKFRFLLPHENFLNPAYSLFWDNYVLSGLPSEINMIFPLLAEFVMPTQRSINSVLELVSNKETNNLFVERKNLFSFIADGTADFREFNIPLTMFPRTDVVTLKQDIIVRCQPVIADGTTFTNTFKIPYTTKIYPNNEFVVDPNFVDDLGGGYDSYSGTTIPDGIVNEEDAIIQWTHNLTYFTIYVNGVAQPFNSLVISMPTANSSGTVRLANEIPIDSLVEFRVNYFADLGDGKTFRIPFNMGFEIYKNGVKTTAYQRMSNNTITMYSAPLPTDKIEVKYWTADSFKIEINNQPTVYKIYAYDNGIPKLVPDNKSTIIFGSVASTDNLRYSNNPIRKIWARDVLRDPGVWINNGNNGVVLQPLGWESEILGHDYAEWDGEFFNTNTLLELTENFTTVAGKPVHEYFCKLYLANVPLVGTKLNFTFHQGTPYLNTAQTKIRDGGFINVTSYVFGFGGFDMIGFDSEQLVLAPGSDVELIEGPFDLEIYYDSTQIFRHPLIQIQPSNPYTSGWDNDAFSDNGVEFDSRVSITDGKYWV